VVQKARQFYPDDADIAKVLGILSYRRQLYPRSVELLEEAAKRRRDDSELLYYLGVGLAQLKQWKECKAAMERALSLGRSPDLADKAKQTLIECSERGSP